MADKRRKCTISDDGMHVTPCEMLESQAEFGHPRGKKRGIFCWQYTSSETGLKTRTFFGVVSTESPNGMIFNCCPFCGERIDHPCLEPDERAELLAKSALSHAAGQEVEDEYLREAFDRFKQACAARGSLVTITKADACTLGLHLQYVIPAVARSEGEDTKRMDWLDSGGTIPVNNYRSVKAVGRVVGVFGVARSARAAIDAAILASSGVGGEKK